VWNNAASEVNSGDAFASFLLGTASGGSADYAVRPFFRSWYFAPYLQDDWKVSRKLTLNMGLRWDYNPTVDEKYDLSLGLRLFVYSFGFMLGTIGLLAIAFMLLVWSLE